MTGSTVTLAPDTRCRPLSVVRPKWLSLFFVCPVNSFPPFKLKLIRRILFLFSLESKNRHEVREAYDITSLEGRFPDEQLPEFRQTVSQLVPELCRLSHRLLKCLALAIGLEEDFFTQCHQNMCQGSEKNATTFRSLYYPSLADRDVCAGVERCGAHSDYGTVTLLLQDDMGGLEVFFKSKFLRF